MIEWPGKVWVEQDENNFFCDKLTDDIHAQLWPGWIQSRVVLEWIENEALKAKWTFALHDVDDINDDDNVLNRNVDKIFVNLCKSFV